MWLKKRHHVVDERDIVDIQLALQPRHVEAWGGRVHDQMYLATQVEGKLDGLQLEEGIRLPQKSRVKPGVLSKNQETLNI